MIASITGYVSLVSGETIVLRADGIGYEVSITPRHLLTVRIDQELTIFTRMVVREDSISLYGFSSLEEREQFDLLCAVNGIGPKLALTVIAGMDSQTFETAVANQDEQAFRNIPGVGPKTAKLILLSLSGKLRKTIPSSSTKVLAALMQLGVSEAEARSVLTSVDANLTEPQMLKAALRAIGARK